MKKELATVLMVLVGVCGAVSGVLAREKSSYDRLSELQEPSDFAIPNADG